MKGSKLNYDKDSLFVRTFRARHPQGVKTFKELIEKGCSLSQVAREFAFSRAYASTAFQKIFGMKHSDYIKTVKKTTKE